MIFERSKEQLELLAAAWAEITAVDMLLRRLQYALHIYNKMEELYEILLDNNYGK